MGINGGSASSSVIAPPPPLVFKMLFLQQPMIAPYQSYYCGQFKPSFVANRAEMAEQLAARPPRNGLRESVET
jgi:hypothetical protein